MHKFKINNKVCVTVDNQTFTGYVQATLSKSGTYLVKLIGSIPGSIGNDPIIPVTEEELELLSE